MNHIPTFDYGQEHNGTDPAMTSEAKPDNSFSTQHFTFQAFHTHFPTYQGDFDKKKYINFNKEYFLNYSI